MMTREEIWDEERREAFDAREYEKECSREKKRMKQGPSKTKDVYWFTRAYPMPKVQDMEFVRDNPEPYHVGYHPSINDPKEDWDWHMKERDAKDEWDRKGGTMHLYLPAIIKAEGNKRPATAFLVYTHVHGGWYERAMPSFDFKRYRRKDGKEHCAVLDHDMMSLGSVVNVTKDFDTFEPALKYAVLKHTQAIGLMPLDAAHNNKPDTTSDMVHAIRVLTCPEDEAPVSPQ